MNRSLIATLITVFAASAPAQTLCNSQEKVVFSCRTTHAKLVSICSSESGLTYRFGARAKVELNYRDPGPSQPDAFQYYHYFRSGVDRTSLEIETSAASYLVFDEHEEPLRPSAGLSVAVKQGNRQAMYACVGKVEVHWYRLDGKVACSDDAMNACEEPVQR